MHCYVCAERGNDAPAVALCHSWQAELCREHLREAAERFAADNMINSCHHDTWSIVGHHHRGGSTSLPRRASAPHGSVA